MYMHDVSDQLKTTVFGLVCRWIYFVYFMKMRTLISFKDREKKLVFNYIIFEAI